MIKNLTIVVRVVGYLALILFFAGCNSKGFNPIASVDKAIDALTNESANWQQTLKDLEKDFADHNVKLVGTVEHSIERIIASGGAEVRCETDFFARRSIQALRAIKAQLQGRDVSPLPPIICSSVPLEIKPYDDKSVVMFGGFDLDKQNMKLFLSNSSQTDMRDVTGLLQHPNHYTMTVNLEGGNGLRSLLDCDTPYSDLLVKDDNGNTLYGLSITVPEIKEEVDKWLFSNGNGFENQRLYFPQGAKIAGVTVMEQGGYGIVNAKIRYVIGKKLMETDWSNDNFRGSERSISCDNITRFVCAEQGGYGLVDLGISDGRHTRWCTKNKDADATREWGQNQTMDELCGVQFREQHNYGLVNVRFIRKKCE